MSFRVITPTFWLVAALAVGLLIFDCAACLLVARLFDAERLVTPKTGTGGIANDSKKISTGGAQR